MGLTAFLCFTPLVLSLKTKLPVHKSSFQRWASASPVDALQSLQEPVWAQDNAYLQLSPGVLEQMPADSLQPTVRGPRAEQAVGY